MKYKKIRTDTFLSSNEKLIVHHIVSVPEEKEIKKLYKKYCRKIKSIAIIVYVLINLILMALYLSN